MMKTVDIYGASGFDVFSRVRTGCRGSYLREYTALTEYLKIKNII